MPVESDEESRRWSEAVESARGVTDAGRIRRRRNRVFLLLTAIIVASWLAGVVLALALPRSADDGSQEVPDSRVLAGLVVEGIGFAALVGGSCGLFEPVATSPVGDRSRPPLTRRQRRQAQRAIAGKQQLDPDRRMFLLALAAQNRRTTEGIVPLYGAILLFNSFSLFIDPKPFQIVLFGLVVALFAIAAAQLTLIYRRSGRFIEQNGDPAG